MPRHTVQLYRTAFGFSDIIKTLCSHSVYMCIQGTAWQTRSPSPCVWQKKLQRKPSQKQRATETVWLETPLHPIHPNITASVRLILASVHNGIWYIPSVWQEKQNEARYLRDHREELIEELATTIVQKVRASFYISQSFVNILMFFLTSLCLQIIQRGKRSEIQAEYEFVWPQIQSNELPSPTSTQTAHATQHSHTTSQHGAVAQADTTSSYSLWVRVRTHKHVLIYFTSRKKH